MVRKSEAASTLPALHAVRHSYQVKRRPICWLRMGRETSVIWPGKDLQPVVDKVALLHLVTSPPGLPQLATFNALNTSQRSWSFRFSLIWKFLSKAQSA